MTAPSTGLPPADSGQSQQPPAGAGQGDATQTFTRKDAETLFETMFNSKSQSIVARTTNSVQRVIDAAKARGINLSPDQAQAVIDAAGQAAAEGVQLKPGQTQAAAPASVQNQTQPPPTGTPSAPAAPIDPVTAHAVKILKEEFGLTDFDPDNLDPDSPEFKLLDLQTDNPETFYASVRAFGKAVAEKKQNAGDASRLPGLGSKGGPAPNAPFAQMRGSEILDSYYSKNPVT